MFGMFCVEMHYILIWVNQVLVTDIQMRQLFVFQEMRETHRFETLVNYFTNPQEFQIEFMVACMQFINIVVHSVEVCED